jgi:hypothetical protein
MKIKSRLIGISLLTIICITSIGLSIETPQFVSGVSARIDPLNINFNSLHDKADAIYDVIDGNDSYLVWNCTTTSGNWAYVFKDGRVAIGSTKELNINNTLWSDWLDVISMLNNVGAGISDQKIWRAWLSSSIFYAPENEIFHRFTYEFSGNFDLNLFVPECTIKEAILGVSRCDASDNYYDSVNPGQAYAIDGTEVTSCSSKSDCCDVPTANITGKIAPGRHKIVASRINAAHVMYISVMTSPMPSKNFTLYSDDKTVWVNELKKSQSMDKFYGFINRSDMGTYEGNITIDRTASPLAKLSSITLDPTSFPAVKINDFVNTTCAKSGYLKKEDFNIQENSKYVAIDNVYFTGNASGRKLDLAIVFDDTGSMGKEIGAMKSKVEDLTTQIQASGMDARYALVTFTDEISVKTNWTSDPEIFKQAISALQPRGGDDEPEDSLDAIENIISMQFRNDTQKAILVITDAHAHFRGDGTSYSKYTKEEVKRDLKDNGIIFIPVSPSFEISSGVTDLRDVANEIQSMWIDINSAADFANILDQIRRIITGTYVLEYTSPDLTPGTYRNVTVMVNSQLCDGAVGSANTTYRSPMKP